MLRLLNASSLSKTRKSESLVLDQTLGNRVVQGDEAAEIAKKDKAEFHCISTAEKRYRGGWRCWQLWMRARVKAGATSLETQDCCEGVCSKTEAATSGTRDSSCLLIVVSTMDHYNRESVIAALLARKPLKRIFPFTGTSCLDL